MKNRKWTIDLVRPFSDFDWNNPEERAAATHHTNLSPRWQDEVPERTPEEREFLAQVESQLVRVPPKK